MAALAVETSTIRLASNGSQIPLLHPGVLAHQAVTVDQISGGRVELGLGTGPTIDPGTEMIELPTGPTPNEHVASENTASCWVCCCPRTSPLARASFADAWNTMSFSPDFDDHIDRLVNRANRTNPRAAYECVKSGEIAPTGAN